MINNQTIPKIAIIDEQSPCFLEPGFNADEHKHTGVGIDAEYSTLCDNIKHRLLWLYDNNYRILMIVGKYEGINSVIFSIAQELKRDEGAEIALFLIGNKPELLHTSGESINLHAERVCLL